MLSNRYRKDFPVLEKPIVYLDSACMALKPRSVIQKITEYYEQYPACGGRSQHKLGEKVELGVQSTRLLAAKFLGSKADEIMFTKNATESLNITAGLVQKGDTVITTDKEHNSNLAPWLQKGVNREVISTADGFDFTDFEKKVVRAKVVSLTHMANLDGTTIPLKEITKIAHKHNAIVVVDAAQSAAHLPINVKKLDVDFLAFSGHKVLGPTGVGFLYGKKKLLETLPSLTTGGGTVFDSWYDKIKEEKAPMKFEAGLQNYSGIIGMQEAFKYVNAISMSAIAKHEIALNKIMTDSLDVDLIGPSNPEERGGVFSFNIPKMDSHTVALLLNEQGIFVRSGAHCVHSWFNANKLAGSVRASTYLYNSKEDVEKFVEQINNIKKLS